MVLGLASTQQHSSSKRNNVLEQSGEFGRGVLAQTSLLSLRSVQCERFTGTRKSGGSGGETHTATVSEEPAAAAKQTALAATHKALQITVSYLPESPWDKSFRSIVTRLETSVSSESNLGTQKPKPSHLPFRSLDLKILVEILPRLSYANDPLTCKQDLS